jgi:U3 small nucleolar RNA-associated protein 18
VDGHTSPLLTTLSLPSLPLTSQHSLTFHPSGSHLLITGPRPFYCLYDLQSGVLTDVGARHSLWGPRIGDSIVGGFGARKRKGGPEAAVGIAEATGGAGGGIGLSLPAFSPYPGTTLAIAGKGSSIHLFDWKNSTSTSPSTISPSNASIATLTLPTTTGISGMFWRSERELMTLSNESEVFVWDVGMRRCVERWRDVGGFRRGGGCLAGWTGSNASSASGWLGIGSNIGLVNVYGPDALSSSRSTSPDGEDLPSTTSSHTPTPKLLKTLENLTTGITTLKFTPDGQMLAMGSRDKKDALRLVSSSIVFFLKHADDFLAGPSPFAPDLLKLAYHKNTAGLRNVYGFFPWWRIYGCGEYKGKGRNLGIGVLDGAVVDSMFS